FEDWVINRFGRRLYNIFFKTYTEKVWGTPCNQISAEWAAQRIQGLSLKTAVINALVGDRSKSKEGVIKTLIGAFHYPKGGPGMMWETVVRELEDNGRKVMMNADVTKIGWAGNAVTSLSVKQQDSTNTLTADHFISSMPIRELVRKLDPAPPLPVQKAAASLKYRDFLTVALMIDEAELFPDNWIYIHDDSVKVGRIQNFKNWSPYMVPDSSKTCLGLEYFCFEGDGLWTMSDADLIELGKKELHALGLADKSKIEDGAVVRMPKAYPVYDNDYAEALGIVREFLASLQNLQLVGRNGMHKYNNQDHSMLTAMLAAENIQGANHDLWSVNVEQEYLEEVTAEDAERSKEYAALAATQPQVPETLAAPGTIDEILSKTFARLDKAALATAIGSVSGAILLFATIGLLLRNGPNTGAHLQLLSQYFYGYSVTYQGAVIGFAHAFLWGFILGWLFAYLRNLALGVYVSFILRRARSLSLSRVLDYI
ncbi:MAG: hypothetical protein OEU36_25910, partial [Gammaproteobacteria bacterium]|nr:hypothetical protein [Gammaproteobacteria bacterium]